MAEQEAKADETGETAWAVKIRASADDEWGWAGEERGEGFRAVFFAVWWARALCGTREDAQLLAGDWCGLDAQHEAKLVRVTRNGGSPTWAEHERDVREKALDEAQAAIGAWDADNDDNRALADVIPMLKAKS